MAKNLNTLANTHRQEHYDSLMKMPDRDMCEMVRAHFESHPTLPGEKALKTQVNDILSQFEKSNNGSEYHLDADAKHEIASQYAQTRIRETPLKEGNYYLDFRHFNPSDLKRESLDNELDAAGRPIFVGKTNVELQKNDAGEVYVLAELSEGGFKTIGTLPDSFLVNNPMNVDFCEAELQINDYSNGQMKNLSARIIVDTDLMSGDVLNLDEDMFAEFDQETGLEQ